MTRQDWRRVRYVALDFETTGLDPETDAVLSFGVVPIEEGRIRLDRAVYRIADPGRSLPAETVKIHGIRPADLVAAPKLEELRDELSGIIGDHQIVAWSAFVEAAFLAVTLGKSRRAWSKRLIDVRHLVVRLEERGSQVRSPAREDSLHDTAARFGIPLEDAHHALADAFVTAELFVMVASRLGLDTDSVVKLGRRPPPQM